MYFFSCVEFLIERNRERKSNIGELILYTCAKMLDRGAKCTVYMTEKGTA